MKKMGKSNTLQASKIITSPSLLKEFLKENSISLKKRLGQNFLFDKNIITKLIKSMDLKKTDTIVEVGAGIGNISIFYLPKIKYAYLFEIDKGLTKILKNFINFKNVEILHTNFLKGIDLNKILDKNKKYKFFSNLPYSVATQIIIKVIDNIQFFKEIYIMVPEAIYNRMISPPKSKDFSRFTVMIQSFFRITYLFSVSKNSFFPVPEVDSIFLKMVPISQSTIKYTEMSSFKKFLQILFSSRRKKIKGALQKIYSLYHIPENYGYSIANELNIDLSERIQEISVSSIVKLFKKIISFSKESYRK